MKENGQAMNAKYKLGELCKYGHDYQGTGMSLRYVKRKGGCVECARIENTSEKKKKINREYNQAHREDKVRIAKKWNMDNPEQHRQAGHRLRLKQTGNATLNLPQTALNWHIASFDGCAYCDGPYEHLDHVMPSSKGGYHGLSNIVPACQRCNLSKNAEPAWTWYQRQPWYSAERERVMYQRLTFATLIDCDVLIERYGYERVL